MKGTEATKVGTYRQHSGKFAASAGCVERPGTTCLYARLTCCAVHTRYPRALPYLQPRALEF